MNTTNNYKDLITFLAKHSAKNDKNDTKISPTHTRIPDTTLNIFGGSYIIPNEEYDTFYKLYYDLVFRNNKFEYPYKCVYLVYKKDNEINLILLDVFSLSFLMNLINMTTNKENKTDLNTMYFNDEISSDTILQYFPPFQSSTIFISFCFPNRGASHIHRWYH
jgi:hypothetical protein